MTGGGRGRGPLSRLLPSVVTTCPYCYDRVGTIGRLSDTAAVSTNIRGTDVGTYQCAVNPELYLDILPRIGKFLSLPVTPYCSKSRKSSAGV